MSSKLEQLPYEDYEIHRNTMLINIAKINKASYSLKFNAAGEFNVNIDVK